MPEGLAKQYQEQMDKGGLVFLTESNEEQMKGVIPPDLFEQKNKELALQRAERMAPPRVRESIPTTQECLDNIGEHVDATTNAEPATT